jgi:hypothetical protein
MTRGTLTSLDVRKAKGVESRPCVVGEVHRDEAVLCLDKDGMQCTTAGDPKRLAGWIFFELLANSVLFRMEPRSRLRRVSRFRPGSRPEWPMPPPPPLRRCVTIQHSTERTQAGSGYNNTLIGADSYVSPRPGITSQM